MSGAFTQFDYLLNAFEQASQSEKPAAHDYKGKREALYAYVRNLEAQSRPPSTQSAGVVELPEHFATICDDGHWLLNLRGPHGHNHINAGWPSKKVYTEDQVRALLATPPAGGGKEALSDAERTFLVLSADGEEGVLFKCERDARWTATGEGTGADFFGVPTLGEAFRELYDGDNEFEIVEIDLAAIRAGKKG